MWEQGAAPLAGRSTEADRSVMMLTQTRLMMMSLSFARSYVVEETIWSGQPSPPTRRAAAIPDRTPSPAGMSKPLPLIRSARNSASASKKAGRAPASTAPRRQSYCKGAAVGENGELEIGRDLHPKMGRRFASLSKARPLIPSSRSARPGRHAGYSARPQDRLRAQPLDGMECRFNDGPPQRDHGRGRRHRLLAPLPRVGADNGGSQRQRSRIF